MVKSDLQIFNGLNLFWKSKRWKMIPVRMRIECGCSIGVLSGTGMNGNSREYKWKKERSSSEVEVGRPRRDAKFNISWFLFYYFFLGLMPLIESDKAFN